MTIEPAEPDSYLGESLRLLRFEYIHSACPLTIYDTIQVKFKSYHHNQGVMTLFDISILIVEESTLGGVRLFLSDGLDSSITIIKEFIIYEQ